MKEMNISIPMIGGDATNNVDLIKIAGDAARATALFPRSLPSDIDTPMAKDFLRAFEAKYKSSPASIWAVTAGDAFNVIVAAVKAKGTDKAAIAEYLHKDLKNFNTLTEPFPLMKGGPRG